MKTLSYLIVPLAIAGMIITGCEGPTQNPSLTQSPDQGNISNNIESFQSNIESFDTNFEIRKSLTFSYTDPVEDHTGTIDVTEMSVIFDNTSGEYEIVLRATSQNPFVGNFRVNINLFNPDVESSHSKFNDNLNDYNLTEPTTKLILNGTNSNLQAWHAGDRVATNTEAGVGNPPNTTLFRTGVLNLPLDSESLPQEDNIAFGTEGLTTITLETVAPLTFTYTDPEQDQGDAVFDVTEMNIVFDNTSGEYGIILRSTAQNPFIGQFRVNINLYNPDTYPNQSFFSEHQNDYNLSESTTKLILTGTNPDLKVWNAEDRVAAWHYAVDNPPSIFGSSVSELPEFFPKDDIALGIPIPATTSLGLTTIKVFTPQEAVEFIMDDVEMLLDEDQLTEDQADGLMDKLDAALTSLNQDNIEDAYNQLQAFINQVNAFINSRKLTPEQGQSLIDSANQVMEAIS